MQIEQRILGTPEAAQVILPLSSVDQGVAEVRTRYASQEEFIADLERSNLDPVTLRQSIERDLKVEAVLDGVASHAAKVSETDVEIFYLVHSERFRRPETRTLRHILSTINDGLAGSERDAARQKIDAIHSRLCKAPERFAEQAQKHSECPTAMNGGLLGDVAPGKLFPELEPAAFALAPGELSGVVESPLGFHILLCDAIQPAGEVSLDSERERIRGHLEDTRRRSIQKAWIAGLFRRET
ncbi:MAG: nitrogen fixation protein NifM [Rhodopseudomonas sp.]|uniref:nitrogen fixation protein NifM n=1 Tax=Rhodopseudomonas sp. TaxID=1078 RepID=UPI001793EABA|nr:nitrogen fixation protein NifM [Rhodopseudomonas sp.]NVN88930.1 nitrogen fixation protein NifM [Rhodopseudomonas sp.]